MITLVVNRDTLPVGESFKSDVGIGSVPPASTTSPKGFTTISPLNHSPEASVVVSPFGLTRNTRVSAPIYSSPLSPAARRQVWSGIPFERVGHGTATTGRTGSPAPSGNDSLRATRSYG